jgi:hypothetical protein
LKLNLLSFPADFMLQLTENELENLRSQFVTLKRGPHRKYLPNAFTEPDQRFQIAFEATKPLIFSPTPAPRKIGFHAP